MSSSPKSKKFTLMRSESMFRASLPNLDVADSASGLLTLIRDPDTFPEILDLSDELHCGEVVRFFLAATEFRACEDTDERVVMGSRIWETFLKDGAPLELNVSGEERHGLKERYRKGAWDQNALDNMEKECVRMLTTTVYFKFKERAREASRAFVDMEAPSCTVLRKDWTALALSAHRSQFQVASGKATVADLGRLLGHLISVMLAGDPAKVVPEICDIIERMEEEFPNSALLYRKKGMLMSYFAVADSTKSTGDLNESMSTWKLQREKTCSDLRREMTEEKETVFEATGGGLSVSGSAEMGKPHQAPRCPSCDKVSLSNQLCRPCRAGNTSSQGEITFSNAVEAFSHGRNYNKRKMSHPDVQALISHCEAFSAFKGEVKDNLIEAEHHFETSQLLEEPSAALNYDWALHYFWAASYLMDHADGANVESDIIQLMYLVCSRCRASFVLDSKFVRPLTLWSRALANLASTHLAATSDHQVRLVRAQMVYFETALVQFGEGPLSLDLAAVELLCEADSRVIDHKSLCASLFKLARISNSVHTRAASTKLMLELCAATRSNEPRKVHRLLHDTGITATEALANVRAFAALLRLARLSDRLRKQKHPSLQADLTNFWDVKDTKFDELFPEKNPKSEYRWNTTLGSGGFGEVYLADHKDRKESDARVALKRIEIPANDTAKKAIIAEVETMRVCARDAFIVSIQECFQYQGSAYIAMEYANGGSLQQLVANVSFTEGQVAHIMVRVVYGVAFLASLRYVHRDLKPANILLSLDGNVKVGDLGLVAPELEVRHTDSRAGSGYYRAPEVLMGHGSELMSDVWGIGTILYSMLEGQRMYKELGELGADWLVMTAGAPALSESWGEDMNDFYAQCTQLEASKRTPARRLKKHPFLRKQCEGSEIRDLCESSFVGVALDELGL